MGLLIARVKIQWLGCALLGWKFCAPCPGAWLGLVQANILGTGWALLRWTAGQPGVGLCHYLLEFLGHGQA